MLTYRCTTSSRISAARWPVEQPAGDVCGLPNGVYNCGKAIISPGGHDHFIPGIEVAP